MLSDEDFQDISQSLRSEKTQERASALRCLSANTDDPRLLPYIEPLLEDKTVCIVHIPIHYGEIRYLAATALAEVRAAVGVWEKVCVEFVVPLNVTELNKIARATGIEERRGLPGHEGTFELFARLREMGKLPMATIELDPVEKLEIAKMEAEAEAKRREAEEKEGEKDYSIENTPYYIRQPDGTWKKY
ncbi:hypothetical protein [Anthocerotibacter panamensis]|uniref:hypothetical protein n=1 Tax=Anthocerotibacter panamensis TaxID=2857077 RepID=UPI001C406641|nr:hypothetical protein [Anthocerotibacter panamensis]